jgi:hypothetical protein
MAIYIKFYHYKKVIFHSYVSLPEGNTVDGCEEILHQFLSVVYPCLSHYLFLFIRFLPSEVQDFATIHSRI